MSECKKHGFATVPGECPECVIGRKGETEMTTDERIQQVIDDLANLNKSIDQFIVRTDKLFKKMTELIKEGEKLI